MGFPGGSVVKNLPTNAGDMGSIPGLGRSLGRGHGNSFQYSCLEYPMDRGAWRATVHRVAKRFGWIPSLFTWNYHSIVNQLWVLSCFSHVWLFATLWTVASQAPLSMGFSRQEYRSGLLCPTPGDLPDSGIQPGSPTLQADSLPLSYQGVSYWSGLPCPPPNSYIAV